MTTCSTCKFWDEKHTSCHAYPPTHDGWPQACVDDWCGEHQPKCIEAVAGEDVFGGKNAFHSSLAFTTGTGHVAVRLCFQDWRITAPEVFVSFDNEKEGCLADWVRLFNADGIVLFNGCLERYRATKNSPTNKDEQLYYSRMLEYCNLNRKVKP